MSFRLKTLSLALAATGLLALCRSFAPAYADALIIQNPSDLAVDTEVTIIRPTSRAGRPFGGRIIHTDPRHKYDSAVRYVRPRYPKLDLTALNARDSEDDLADDTDVRAVHLTSNHITLKLYFGRTCNTDAPLYLYAGERFQAGGNMLRVPPEETACGRNAVKSRIFQRYLGFKRVYKGQVYTGFKRLYSGRRYLNGNY